MPTTRVRISAADDDASGAILCLLSLEAPGLALPVANQVMLNPGSIADRIQAFEAARLDTANETTVVSDAGSALWDRLARHAAAQPAFARTLQNGMPDRELRVAIHPNALDAESLPWEVLRAPDRGFLEADLNVPIVREIEAAGPDQPVPALRRGEPLRILTVIAAEGNDGRGEWAALRRALGEVTVPVHAQILLADEALREAIDAQGTPAAPVTLDTSFVSENASRLERRIRDFAPHIAHFFCHGTAEQGGYLQFANLGSTTGGGQPTILMPASLEAALVGSAWLVLLNACSGAEVAANGRSGSATLSRRLVSAGVPVVVGMRDEIEAPLAHAFAEAFLGGCLRTLSQMIEAREGEPNYAPHLSEGRRAILAARVPGAGALRAAVRSKEWTFPVLSVRSNEFRFKVLATDLGEREMEAAHAELDELSRQARLLAGLLTEAQHAAIATRIADLKAQLGLD